MKVNYTIDAIAAANLFKQMPHVALTFNTPSRIHPRMMGALQELVTGGVINQQADALGEGIKLTFRLHDPAALSTIRRMSQADQKRISLPMTVD